MTTTQTVTGVPQLTELVEATNSAGWRPLDLKTASLDDWDQFALGFMRDWEQAVMTAQTEAEADEARLGADDYRSC